MDCLETMCIQMILNSTALGASDLLDAACFFRPQLLERHAASPISEAPTAVLFRILPGHNVSKQLLKEPSKEHMAGGDQAYTPRP